MSQIDRPAMLECFTTSVYYIYFICITMAVRRHRFARAISIAVMCEYHHNIYILLLYYYYCPLQSDFPLAMRAPLLCNDVREYAISTPAATAAVGPVFGAIKSTLTQHARITLETHFRLSVRVVLLPCITSIIYYTRTIIIILLSCIYYNIIIQTRRGRRPSPIFTPL